MAGQRLPQEVINQRQSTVKSAAPDQKDAVLAGFGKQNSQVEEARNAMKSGAITPEEFNRTVGKITGVEADYTKDYGQTGEHYADPSQNPGAKPVSTPTPATAPTAGTDPTAAAIAAKTENDKKMTVANSKTDANAALSQVADKFAQYSVPQMVAEAKKQSPDKAAQIDAALNDGYNTGYMNEQDFKGYLSKFLDPNTIPDLSGGVTTGVTKTDPNAVDPKARSDGWDSFFSMVMGSGEQSMNELLKSLDPTAKLQLTALGIITQKDMDRLQAHEDLANAEYDAEKAKIDADQEEDKSLLEQSKALSLDANKAAEEKTDKEYAQKLELAEDNFSRLDGFLKAKLAASGALDSGAGLQKLVKYTQAGQLALNDLEQDRAEARQFYLGKNSEIMLKYTENSLKITRDSRDARDKIRADRDKDLQDIRDKQTLSENNKIEKTVEIISANQERIKAKEAEEYKRKQDLYAQAYKEQQDQFDNSISLATLNMNQTKYQTDQAQEAVKTLLDKGGADAVQYIDPGVWQKAFGLDASSMQGFAASMKSEEASKLVDKLFEKGVFVTANDIAAAKNGDASAQYKISSGLRAASTAGSGLGDYQFNGVDLSELVPEDSAVSKFAANCVQYLRSYVPNFPPAGSGMYTYDDKNKAMLAAGWVKYDFPIPGAVVVEDTKVPDPDTGKLIAHVASINRVSPDRKQVIVDEANYKSGRITHDRNLMTSKAAKTYWVNPRQEDNGDFYLGLAESFDQEYKLAAERGTKDINKLSLIGSVLSRSKIKGKAYTTANDFLLNYAQTPKVGVDKAKVGPAYPGDPLGEFGTYEPMYPSADANDLLTALGIK